MAKNSGFKVGDIVVLKSGGPKMTVEDPDTYKSIECQWFVGGKLNKGRFDPASLQMFVEPKA